MQRGQKAYLRGRGLKGETIALLGFNAEAAHQKPRAWGLPAGKNVWLPRGIVIPAIDRGLVHRMRIRLTEDEFTRSKAWTAGKGIKYAEITGSRSEPLFLPGKGDAWVVVESELDAYLIRQEAADLVSVLGLGSTTGKPTAQMLKDMAGKRVLLCLDHDTPGMKAARTETWAGIGEYFPTPSGKDPGEYAAAGGKIREWIEVCLAWEEAEYAMDWEHCLDCEWVWWANGSHVCLDQGEKRVEHAVKTCRRAAEWR